MLNTDTYASDFITFLDAIEADTRLKPLDRNILTNYRTKLAGATTTPSEDLQVLGIFERWFAKIRKNK